MILEKQRKKVIEIAQRAYNEKLIPLTMGNFSIRDKKRNYVCITPSGMEYNLLKPEDITVVDMDGNIVDGQKKPSTETPMHLAVYKKREDLCGIAHTHSTYATAWACCHKGIPVVVAELIAVIGGPVECAPYETMGTTKLATTAAEWLKDRQAVLLANHGVLATGETLDKAYTNAVVVEEGAKVAFIASQIGNFKLIPEEECFCLVQAIKEKYGQGL